MSTNQNPGCLGVLFGLRRAPAGKSAAVDLPYRLRDDFLSAAELSFYRVLATAIGSDAAICPKVNLGDIMFVARPHENMAARGRISQKHVDFLLCDPVSMRPLAGVELDDASHKREDRQARDEFVDSVFSAASLPLVHVPVRTSYVPGDIAALVRPYLTHAPLAAPTATGGGGASAMPLCPKCGIPMVLRTAGRGDRQGEQFYGCSNYPKCRETATP